VYQEFCGDKKRKRDIAKSWFHYRHSRLKKNQMKSKRGRTFRRIDAGVAETPPRSSTKRKISQFYSPISSSDDDEADNIDCRSASHRKRQQKLLPEEEDLIFRVARGEEAIHDAVLEKKHKGYKMVLPPSNATEYYLANLKNMYNDKQYSDEAHMQLGLISSFARTLDNAQIELPGKISQVSEELGEAILDSQNEIQKKMAEVSRIQNEIDIIQNEI